MKEKVVDGSLIGKAHERIAAVVRGGDTVVDATLGNGHDTLFLVRQVCSGEKGGKVIGFDIQEEALVSTRQRLSGEGIDEVCYELHLASHEEMARYVPRGVRAVMFNLGYLPGGDKRKITRVDSTLEALGSALELLHVGGGGVLTVMCYPGHPGGDDEAEKVKEWLNEEKLNEERWNEKRLGDGLGKPVSVDLYQRRGAIETTPFLLVVAVNG